MLKLPSRELETLIDKVLARHGWTATRLAKELNVKPYTISRWRANGGIYKGHYEELLRFEKDELIAGPGTINESVGIPFSVTIPRDSIKVSLDQNGDYRVSWVVLPMLNKEE